MTSVVEIGLPSVDARAEAVDRLRRVAEAVTIPAVALLASLALFGVFMGVQGVSPIDLYALMIKGAFGSWFSVQNSLQRAAPLILTALCVALPARLGLMIIGGEGALVVGGLCAATTGVALHGLPPLAIQITMAITGMIGGAVWISLAGALRHWRGINETISSLLLGYIAIAVFNHLVEGWLRDPASLNKPSTAHIGESVMLGPIPGTDVHMGLVFGVIMCVVCWILMDRTPFGFAARMAGGNVRAARMAGLSVGKLILMACALGGAAAGLAGMVEVAAVHGRANASLMAGYGFTGILVAFLARQHPLAIIPMAILMGGIAASGGLLQRRLGIPDASILVLQGIIFVVLLASETLAGRFKLFGGGR
jgi:general nucleoside transport system permease protein